MSDKPPAENTPKRSYRLRSLARGLFFAPLDLTASLFPINKIQKDGRKRVVFARLDSVGDYIIWTATFPIFEKAYPKDKFEKILIANSGWADLAEKSGFFDRVIRVQRKRFVKSPLYRFQIIRKVRSINPDIFINPTLSRDLLWADSLAKVSGADEIIGSSGINNRMSNAQNRKSDSWYSQIVDVSSKAEHELVNNHRFACSVAGLGNETSLNLPDLSFVNKTKEKKRSAILFIGANHPFRRWPAENFAKAAQFLSDECGLQIILARGPGEEHLAEEFAAYYKGEVQHLTGKVTLAEMAEIMASARLVVSNDTGPAHMAAAVGCPAVIVMSGAELGRFFPYPQILTEQGLKQVGATYELPCFGCAWNCIYTDLPADSAPPCITNITPQNVIEKIRTILE